MNDARQFKIDVKHFNVSFVPVIAKNRSASDNYFCMVHSAQAASIRDLGEAELNHQQKILNQQSALLAEFTPNFLFELEDQ